MEQRPECERPGVRFLYFGGFFYIGRSEKVSVRKQTWNIKEFRQTMVGGFREKDGQGPVVGAEVSTVLSPGEQGGGCWR